MWSFLVTKMPSWQTKNKQFEEILAEDLIQRSSVNSLQQRKCNSTCRPNRSSPIRATSRWENEHRRTSSWIVFEDWTGKCCECTNHRYEKSVMWCVRIGIRLKISARLVWVFLLWSNPAAFQWSLTKQSFTDCSRVLEMSSLPVDLSRCLDFCHNVDVDDRKIAPKTFRDIFNSLSAAFVLILATVATRVVCLTSFSIFVNVI